MFLKRGGPKHIFKKYDLKNPQEFLKYDGPEHIFKEDNLKGNPRFLKREGGAKYIFKELIMISEAFSLTVDDF